MHQRVLALSLSRPSQPSFGSKRCVSRETFQLAGGGGETKAPASGRSERDEDRLEVRCMAAVSAARIGSHASKRGVRPLLGEPCPGTGPRPCGKRPRPGTGPGRGWSGHVQKRDAPCRRSTVGRLSRKGRISSRRSEVCSTWRVVCSSEKRSCSSVSSSRRMPWQSSPRPTSTCAESAGKPEEISHTCRSCTSVTPGCALIAASTSSGRLLRAPPRAGPGRYDGGGARRWRASRLQPRARRSGRHARSLSSGRRGPRPRCRRTRRGR